MASNTSKPTRGRKKLKAGTGIHLSPSKTKVKRGKRAGCWKYFKEIHVQSEKEFGVMVTKAKCRFCHKVHSTMLQMMDVLLLILLNMTMSTLEN